MNNPKNELERELSFIKKNMNEMICRISPDGIIEYASDSYLRNFGYKPETLTGRRMDDFIHAEDKEKFAANLEQAMLLTAPAYIRQDLRFINTSGKCIWIEMILNPICGKAGRADGVAACLRSIVEKKTIETFALRNKTKYQKLFENMDTGFAYFKVLNDHRGGSYDYIMLECNTAFERIVGSVLKNGIGKKVSEIFKFSDEWFLYILHQINKVTLFGEPVGFEIKTRRHSRYLACSAYSPYEGCVAVLLSDITEERTREELQKILTNTSTRFISIQSDKIGEEIENTLRIIVQLYETERSCVFLFSEDHTATAAYEWCMIDVPREMETPGYPGDGFQWLISQIKHNMTVQISDLDDIPEEALLERNYCEMTGFKSMIFTPITYKGKVLGYLGIYSLVEGRWLSSAQTDILKIICAIFANAIEREKADEVLQNEINELIRVRGILKDSEEKFKKLTLSMQDAVILIDSEERVINWNKSATRIFGYTYDEVARKQIHDLIVPPQYLERAHGGFQKTMLMGTGRFVDKIIEISAQRKDGSIFPAEIALSIISIKGKKHAVGIVRDITERKMAQREILMAMDAAEAANSAKSQFLANMSHEIRTPMNGIIGFVDLLSKTTLDNRQADYVREIKIASDSLMAIINDLLDFSKIEANRLELEKVEFNIGELIEEVASLFSPRACENDVEINVMIDASIPAFVKGDPARLRQVLENLLSNAVKFTHNGEVFITAKAGLQTEEQVEIIFKVIDTGIGMSASDQKRLFTPFTQIDASTTRKYGGTGLGLAITKKLVEAMSGKIDVESIKGKGSTFTLDISFEKAADGRKSAAIPLAELSRLGILLADQSSTSRMVIKYYLEKAGCSVCEAENSSKVLELLKECALNGNKIKIAIINNALPGQSGLELAYAVKSDDSLKDTALILLTSVVGFEEKSAYEQAGFSAYLQKPVYKYNLLNCVIKAAGISDRGVFGKRQEPMDEVDVSYSSTLRNVKILLAEDNPTNRKLAASILATAGFRCDIAENGLAAIKLLENGGYDLVLMDCQMPVMDGYEATKAIRRNESGNEHITVIAMTANAMKSDYENCIKSGMDDYISKPFKAGELIGIIKKWLAAEHSKAEKPHGTQPVIIPALEQQEETGGKISEILDTLAVDQRLDRMTVYEIYNEFIDMLPDFLTEMNAAASTEDYQALRMKAHTLKGSSAGLRLKSLSQMAAELEKQSREQNAGQCLEYINKIMDYRQTYLMEKLNATSEIEG